MSEGAAGARGDRVWPGLIAALLLLAAARLVLTALMPLMDTTESRYGDIAHQMAVRGDWVTPWFTNESPFWGKPPLAFWLSAIGFRIFGFNEFAARAPHWLLGVLLAALVWWQGRAASRRTAWHAATLLAGSALFLTLSGAVLTDMALALGNALVMIGVWRAATDPAPAGSPRQAQVLIALGAIIGLLAKGPVAILLCAMPLLGWGLWTRRLRLLWQRVAWVRLALVVVTVVGPWYALAEARTPGFLSYFLVGEHWHRFVTPGWQGDLYGTAHVRPHGMIWVFALAAVLPWTLLAPLVWWRGRGQGRDPQSPRPAPGQGLYLLAWAMAPMVLFTMAGNILWTYVLPGLPAAALGLASYTARLPRPRQTDIGLSAVLAAWILAMALAVPAMRHYEVFERYSVAWAVSLVEQQVHVPDAPVLYVGPAMPFSLSFYTNRQARRVDSLHALPSALRCPSSFVVLPLQDASALQPGPGERITRLGASRTLALLRIDCTAVR